jgi:hypothetical protein
MTTRRTRYDPDVERIANAAADAEAAKGQSKTNAAWQPTIAEQIYKHLIPNQTKANQKGPRR